MDTRKSPLAPATFFVLLALAGGEKHGYAIMKDVRELSDGRVQMGPATLYTTIQRLVESGWITEVEHTGDARRRNYRLSADGRRALQEELQHMEALVKKTKALRLRPSEPRG
jgi:DNA-binding PadR family transcriptional regulator